LSQLICDHTKSQTNILIAKHLLSKVLTEPYGQQEKFSNGTAADAAWCDTVQIAAMYPKPQYNHLMRLRSVDAVQVDSALLAST